MGQRDTHDWRKVTASLRLCLTVAGKTEDVQGAKVMHFRSSQHPQRRGNSDSSSSAEPGFMSTRIYRLMNISEHAGLLFSEEGACLFL